MAKSASAAAAVAAAVPVVVTSAPKSVPAAAATSTAADTPVPPVVSPTANALASMSLDAPATVNAAPPPLTMDSSTIATDAVATTKFPRRQKQPRVDGGRNNGGSRRSSANASASGATAASARADASATSSSGNAATSAATSSSGNVPSTTALCIKNIPFSMSREDFLAWMSQQQIKEKRGTSSAAKDSTHVAAVTLDGDADAHLPAHTTPSTTIDDNDDDAANDKTVVDEAARATSATPTNTNRAATQLDSAASPPASSSSSSPPSTSLPVPHAITFLMDQATGNFRGMAFANYRTQEDATRAVHFLNGATIQRRKLKAEFKMVREKVVATTSTRERVQQSGVDGGDGETPVLKHKERTVRGPVATTTEAVRERGTYRAFKEAQAAAAAAAAANPTPVAVIADADTSSSGFTEQQPQPSYRKLVPVLRQPHYPDVQTTTTGGFLYPRKCVARRKQGLDPTVKSFLRRASQEGGDVPAVV